MSRTMRLALRIVATNNIRMVHTKDPSEAKAYVQEIVNNKLYVVGRQGPFLFNYFLKYPKRSLMNPKSKDYQLSDLAVAFDQEKIVAWAARVQGEEQFGDEYAVWAFTHPDYRNKGIASELKSMLPSATR